MAEFNPDAYIAEKTASLAPQGGTAPAFDPAAYLAQKGATSAPTAIPSASEAALRGVGQGMSMGTLDEVTGGGESVLDKILGKNPEKSIGELYHQHTEEARANNAAAQAAHPYVYGAGNIAGGVATGALTGGLGATTALGRIGATAGMGALSGAGYSNAEDLQSGVKEALKGAAVGGTLGTAAEGIASALNPAALRSTAENLAENATGATGAQRAQFQPGTGRYLLDKGHVGFGSSPENIAESTQNAITKSGQGIEDTLANKMPDVTVDRNDVIAYIQKRIDAFKGNDAKSGLVSKLKNAQENIAAQTEGASSEIPIAQAEQIKRDYQANANWQSPKIENDTNAIVSDAYKQAVEDAAVEANPELGAQFQAQKQEIHMLKPVQAAAERRANTLNQSPIGGLLDTAAAGAGGSIGSGIGGPVGAAVGAGAGLGIKALRPRFAAMGAVTVDKAANLGESISNLGTNAAAKGADAASHIGMDRLSDIIRTAPEKLGPWSKQLTDASARGSAALGAANFVLMQSNSDYRQHMKSLLDNQ